MRMRTTVLLIALVVAVDLAWASVRWRAHLDDGPRPPLEEIAEQVGSQFHECIPLGWYPEARPWRGYYPGYTADVSGVEGGFRSEFAGFIPHHPLPPQAASVRAVLDALADAHLLRRVDDRSGTRYAITYAAMPWYLDTNRRGVNGEDWSYLCFSTLKAQRVAFVGRDRVRIDWAPGASAAWVTPFLRAHAVELAPIQRPAYASVVRRPSGWSIRRFDFDFPLVESPLAWR